MPETQYHLQGQVWFYHQDVFPDDEEFAEKTNLERAEVMVNAVAPLSL